MGTLITVENHLHLFNLSIYKCTIFIVFFSDWILLVLFNPKQTTEGFKDNLQNKQSLTKTWVAKGYMSSM